MLDCASGSCPTVATPRLAAAPSSRPATVQPKYFRERPLRSDNTPGHYARRAAPTAIARRNTGIDRRSGTYHRDRWNYRGAARLQKGAEEPQLSVSIGIGLFPDHGRNAQELLEVADRQLYQQKKSGRPELRSTLALAVDVEGETISEVAVIILPSATIPGTNGWQRFRMLQNPDIARRFAQ
jgi:GGDEF domain-containing protein